MNLLPIGSVVRMEDGTKSLLIVGILQTNSEGKMYDYIGCPFPEGYIDADHLFLFNHNDIKDVYYVGFSDEERNEFVDYLEKNYSFDISQDN